MAADLRCCVVTIAHGRHDHLRRQREALRTFHPQVPHVVVAMADDAVSEVAGSDAIVVQAPGHRAGLPLAAARNLGVAVARERLNPELLVLLDVDCLPGPDLVSSYQATAQVIPGGLLCGPVTHLDEGVSPPLTRTALAPLRDPHRARPAPEQGTVIREGDHRLFWSLNFALRPAVWDRIGGFCEAYVGYGGEDTDFACAASAAGVELVWVGGADAYHQHHPVSRPPVEHVVDIVRNAAIFHRRWNWWPMTGWLDAFTASGLVEWHDGLPRVAPEQTTPPAGALPEIRGYREPGV